MVTAKVLVVDDDETLLELFELALAGPGLEVVGCASTDLALELLAREPFAVVLTDLHMPGLAGHEFCRRVAAAYPDTPVVVMTAHAGAEVAIAALRAGARDCLRKPLQLELTRLRLERLAEEHHTRAELRRLRAARA